MGGGDAGRRSCIGVPVPQRVLSARRAKHLHELFVFVVEPDVPPDNNRAERALRHLVTSWKISGEHARRRAVRRRWRWRRCSGHGDYAGRIRTPRVVRCSFPLIPE